MALYEHTFLARPDISVQQAEALVEHFKEILQANGGTMGRTENWGLRPTAYRMDKNRKAHYLHFNIDAPAAAVSEMERQMRIHDDILRYLTIRVEAHEEGISAMMKKNDREERRGGDDRPSRGDDRPPRGDDRPRGPRRDHDRNED